MVIGKNLTFVGAGAGQTFLDGGDALLILQIEAGVIVTLRSLTIRNGKTTAFGGGIENRGTLTLDDVTVTGNQGLQGGRSRISRAR